jgi:ABC-type cobalamin/Fe3+-siderophores transport system ATPase subunit
LISKLTSVDIFKVNLAMELHQIAFIVSIMESATDNYKVLVARALAQDTPLIILDDNYSFGFVAQSSLIQTEKTHTRRN